jgi:hypothetical protein
MDSSLTFSPRQFIELYARGAYDELSEQFLAILRHFAGNFYSAIDFATQRAIDSFVVNFLNLFAQADYLPSRAHGIEFIEHNVTISNLAALSSLKTTDPFLEIVKYQQNNLIKILALYSARNRLHFDRREFFALEPHLAGVWYVAYAGIFHGGLVNPDVCENLKEHYAFQPSTFVPSDKLPDICYGCSYVDSDCERSIKPALNRWVRSTVGITRTKNTPNPKKIAVLSCLWWHGQSSYRIASAYLEALHDYELTLFHVPMPGRQVDTTQFRQVRELAFTDGVLDIAPLLENDFQVALFPDIGMTSFSIWLSNLRIAPIQVVLTGHSVSTWGAEIDYYISGADVEVPADPQRFYSERLILLPGCGAIHQVPDYAPVGRAKTVPEFVLNCPWTGQKTNDRLCRMLGEVIERSQKKLRLRLFVGGGLARGLDCVLFERELSSRLPAAVVEVLPNLSYREYMARLEEGDLTIDAYHYGACNTMADSLYVRKLMASCEGDRWYNRIGPQMLRMVGLPELIAPSPEEYVELIVRLIHDEEWRDSLENRLRTADLQNTIFGREDAKYFKQAIDYLIANHERLQRAKDRSPIRIERDH